jgi:hypothetical protein
VRKGFENRKYERIDHFAFLNVVELKYGNMCKARMFNFSKGGIYFESDSRLNPGTLVFIIVDDSPFASNYGILKYYRALIIWRKIPQDSAFAYGYGTQFKTLNEIRELNARNIKKTREQRYHPRRSYSRSLRIATRKGVIEGTAKNISPSGIFIATRNTLAVDQILTVALPLKNGNLAKIPGRVVWTNGEGSGVKFLKTG